MTKLRMLAALTAGLFAATLGGFAVHAEPAAPVEARNVVLIHGAWADGSSWAEVIPLLQAAGLTVTAVQNPLTSLADSVAATRRVLALQDGPTVLVAHARCRRRLRRAFAEVSRRTGAGRAPGT
jgi:pimeloyl-ACP methyl ester carboxylesterase